MDCDEEQPRLQRTTHAGSSWPENSSGWPKAVFNNFVIATAFSAWSALQVNKKDGYEMDKMLRTYARKALRGKATTKPEPITAPQDRNKPMGERTDEHVGHGHGAEDAKIETLEKTDETPARSHSNYCSLLWLIEGTIEPFQYDMVYNRSHVYRKQLSSDLTGTSSENNSTTRT